MGRLPSSYFEGLYAEAADPWQLDGGWYEERKRALSLAALPDRRYGRAFEPGCATGLLSEGLVERTEELVCWDVSADALGQARSRLGHRVGVCFEQAAVPDQWPAGPFDLIVLSEMAYYLDSPGLAQVLELVGSSLSPLGTLLAVHWRHPAPGYPQTGDAVHEQLRAAPALALVASHAEEDFVLDVFVAAAPGQRGLSVAARTGVL